MIKNDTITKLNIFHISFWEMSKSYQWSLIFDKPVYIVKIIFHVLVLDFDIFGGVMQDNLVVTTSGIMFTNW